MVSSLKDDTVGLAVLGAVDCSNYTANLKYFRRLCVKAVGTIFVTDLLLIPRHHPDQIAPNSALKSSSFRRCRPAASKLPGSSHAR